MKKLTVTRFNNNTWRENILWRERNNYNGCIYNAPVYIRDTIPLMATVYVIEMNNETNKILGIGRILNKVYTDQRYKIYEDQNYNRFTYKGKYRINRDEIAVIELEKLETRLFTTKRHLKRGQGISQVPSDITKEYMDYIEDLYRSNTYFTVRSNY
jgi:hypothetical protein